MEASETLTPPLIEVAEKPDGRHGLRYNFHKGQIRAWKSERRIVLILAGTRGGKALAVDTPIPTPRGFVPIGDLCIGDQVFDQHGRACNVIGAFPVMHARPCFRVTFDDGASVIADAEHLWVTQNRKQRKNAARRIVNPDPSWANRPQCRPTEDVSTRTTAEIRDTLTGQGGAWNHSIDLTGDVEYPDAVLPIQPYTLGVWLGDGTSENADVTTADEAVLAGVVDDGYAVGPARRCNSGKAKAYRLGWSGPRGGDPKTRKMSLNRTLRETGLLGNKGIPDAYLTASVAQRWALLRGLMDTDGSCDRGTRCEFVSVSKTLAIGVLELTRSLGIKSRLSSKIPTINGKACRRCWQVIFTTDKQVFRLPRKMARMNGEVRPQVHRRFIVAVDPVPSVPVRCIAVDSPSRQYLCTRDYIPTHNTSFGPCWFHREMHKKGAGDYLIAAPSYPLLAKAAVPALDQLFRVHLNLGEVNKSPLEFRISPRGEWNLWQARQDKPTRIIFGHADEPESLEAMQAKGFWGDEAGQKRFKGDSFEAINRRLSIDQGRQLITTTPYFLGGYLKEKLHDRAVAGDPYIDLIRFSSIMNPAFPREEWERAKNELPRWKFDMFYRAIFTRPAGLIYDSFENEIGKHVWPRFKIPEHWPIYMGSDFGGVNTAAVYLAAECTPDGKPAAFGTPVYGGAAKPTGRFFAYREYYPREGRSAAAHAAAMKQGEKRLPFCVGGSKSEGQWRLEFAQAGLPISPPMVADVEVGINRVYSLFASGRLIIFEDLVGLREELASYSRELNEAGEVMEEIEDQHDYHHLDALRYIGGYLAAPPAAYPIFMG